jgi:hypothetical protein
MLVSANLAGDWPALAVSLPALFAVCKVDVLVGAATVKLALPR